MRLNGKNAVVTGAGQGMGRDISLCFAVEGADLVLAGRRREPLERLVDEVQSHSGLGISRFELNL